MRATDLKNPLFGELKKYRAIAWDFDGTLIDCAAAPILYDFINTNPRIEHAIVTFRTGRMLHTMWRELISEGGPAQESFSRVLSIPHAEWEAHARLEWMRQRGALSGPPKPEELHYWEWKGKTCSEHGLRVLIDDNFPHTKPGCDRYGVRLIHPDEFL